MYSVYILYNKTARKFYIGQTRNIDQRVLLHKRREFKNSYTSKIAGEWELIYKEVYPDRLSAINREKQLKSFRGREFIKRSIMPE